MRLIRSAPLPVEELLHIEHRVACEHVIDHPRSLMRYDGSRFARTMLGLEAGEIWLARRIVPQKEHRRFREGTLEGTGKSFDVRG